MIDTAIWWTGLATWITLAMIGLGFVIDFLLDLVIKSWWSRKECLAFVADRLKARRQTIPGG